MYVYDKIIRKTLQIRSKIISHRNPLARNLDKGIITIFHDYERHYHHPSVSDFSDKGVQAILKIEKKYAVKATFNTVARLIEEVQPLINLIKGDGHEIASHSYSHMILWDLGKNKLRRDFLKSQKIFKQNNLKILGLRSPQSKWCFRQLPIMLNNKMIWSAENDKSHFPYVIYQNNQKKRLVRFPIKMDDWDYESKNSSPNEMFNKYIDCIDNIAKKKIYGAIGFHPWVQGKFPDRILAFNELIEYIAKNNNLSTLSFSQAHQFFIKI